MTIVCHNKASIRDDVEQRSVNEKTKRNETKRQRKKQLPKSRLLILFNWNEADLQQIVRQSSRLCLLSGTVWWLCVPIESADRDWSIGRASLSLSWRARRLFSVFVAESNLFCAFLISFLFGFVSVAIVLQITTDFVVSATFSCIIAYPVGP